MDNPSPSSFDEQAATRLAAIVDSFDDAVICNDLDNVIISWNQGAGKVFGYTAEEMLRTSIMRLIPADRQEEERQLSGRIRQGESIASFETLRQHKDGRLLAVSVTALPIKDATGKVVSVSFVVRDITEHKRVQEELEWKNAFLEAQIHSSLDGILVVNEQGRKILQNQRFSDLLKIPQHIADDPNDARQLKWIAEFMKDSSHYIEKVIYLNLHPTEISRDEVELFDGTMLDRYSSPVLDKRGKNYGRIWIFRDMTERKRLDRLLQANEEKFRQMAEHISDVFWMTSPDMHQVLYISPAFEVIWGRSAASAYANPNVWSDAMLPEDRARVFAVFSRLMDDEPAVTVEFQIARPDGTVRWISSRGFQIHDAVGKLVRLLGISSDITASKCAEIQLNATLKELEAANVLLRQANAAKERILTVTSHDLRSPLAAVRGLAEYLRDGTLGPVNAKQVETLDYLTGSVAAMLALVNDLLDVTTLDDHAMKLDRKPLDVAPLLRWAGQLFTPIAAKKTMRLSVDAPESGLEVEGDEIRLKRVLENLVMNAIKFSPPNTQITLGARSEGKSIMAWVDDEGPGVPEAEQAKLFTEYGRTSVHPTGGESSTGLGLAICRRIVAAHGGVITMRNRPAGGAHFEFCLPQAVRQTGAESRVA